MPNASIVLTGLAAGYPIPGTYVELDFAQGPAAGNQAPRKVVILGNKSSAGSATADTVIYGPDTQTPVQTETDVINLFGAGSQLHRAFLRFTAINQLSPLYFVAVSESAGAQATLTETIATTATSNGNHRTWCDDQYVDTAISVGDTATVIAGNIVVSVNSQTRWPVTASNVAGVVTYTAVNHGPEGNWIKMQALITPATSVIGTTTTLTANTLLSGGATADVNTTALATIQPASFYYVILCDSDAGNAGRAVTQANNNAAPTVGIRQRVVLGGADTLANEITIATGLNAARAELVWNGHGAVDLPPLECAATMTAIYSLLEQGSPAGVYRKNFSNFPATPTDPQFWPVIAGRAGQAGALTNASIVSALNNGITPINVNKAGQAYLVKGITTRSLNGSNADYRIRDRHKVTVCDYWCDDAQAATSGTYGGRDLLPDPVQGQPPPPPIAVTPRLWGNTLKDVVNRYGNAWQWTYLPGVTPQPGQTPADVINAAIVGPQIETASPNRMSALVPLAPVSIADQFALLAQQVT